MQKDYPNNKTMLILEDGEYESTSEDEDDPAADLTHFDDAQEEDEENGVVYCNFEEGPSLVVTPKVLTVQPKIDHEQRCNLFQTKAKVDGKVCKVIIDGGSCHSLASKEICNKLGLNLVRHPHPYHVQWFSDCGEVKIQFMVQVTFQIGDYCDTVECDVVPMTVCHLLLGRPWQYDRAVQHDGCANQYKLRWKEKDIVLRPMTPSQIINENCQKLEVVVQSDKKREQKIVIHKSVSESHKPKQNGKKKSEGEKLVMLATKSEMREMRDDPTMLHFVLLYKDALISTNELTSLPSVVSCFAGV